MVLLLSFSCNTCPWVIKWEDRYISIAEKYSKKILELLQLNSNISRFDGDDSLEKMAMHASENNYNFAYAQGY